MCESLGFQTTFKVSEFCPLRFLSSSDIDLLVVAKIKSLATVKDYLLFSLTVKYTSIKTLLYDV